MIRAVVVYEPGGPEKLALVERPSPAVGPGEVGIRVAYAGLNWGDIQKRQGIYPDPVAYPAIIGLEVSGVVEAVGHGVKGIAPGQRVAAITGPRMLGGYAEQCVVPAEYVMPLPDAIAFDVGAAFPATALTAWHLLTTASHVTRGTKLLVHAAGGGVGLMVVQLAAERGAVVIGTVGSSAKVDRPRELGATHVINRQACDFVAETMRLTGGEGVDIVIDSLGAGILEHSFDCLRPFGRVINIGEAAGEPQFNIRKKLYERSTSLAGFEFLHARPGSEAWRIGVREIVAHVADGRLKVPIAGVHDLSDAGTAHQRLESREVTGKLILRIGDGDRLPD
ncbi:MAG: quinone oxidoreductase [Hyphomicrobiaceae bacterium]